MSYHHYKNLNSSSMKTTEDISEPPSTVTFSNAGRNGKVWEDEVIKVNVKWDDFEESFELHNNSK